MFLIRFLVEDLLSRFYLYGLDRLWLDGMDGSSESLDVTRSDTCDRDSTILRCVDGVLVY